MSIAISENVLDSPTFWIPWNFFIQVKLSTKLNMYYYTFLLHSLNKMWCFVYKILWKMRLSIDSCIQILWEYSIETTQSKVTKPIYQEKHTKVIAVYLPQLGLKDGRRKIIFMRPSCKLIIADENFSGC